VYRIEIALVFSLKMRNILCAINFSLAVSRLNVPIRETFAAAAPISHCDAASTTKRKETAVHKSRRQIQLLAAFALAALPGCNTQQSRMQSALDAYKGRSVAAFVADHGEPTSSVRLSDNESSFRWVITGSSVGAVIPMGGSLIVAPAGQRVCTVVLTASRRLQVLQRSYPRLQAAIPQDLLITNAPQTEYKDWTIVSWNWQGAC
jgi:hypothetical protein